MTEMIDLLYQLKTQHENTDEFLNLMVICRYCVDNLRSNEDVARSAFNKLVIIPTPDCIAQLNLFERSLMKFYMTCITVVQLCQITNLRMS